MEKGKIKGYIWVALIVVPLVIWIVNKDEEKEELPPQETKTIIKGEYSYFAGEYSLHPVTDSTMIKRGYLTMDEYYDLPISISSRDWREGCDTLEISSDKDLLEAAIILVGKEKSDTINFRLCNDYFSDYILCISEHNTKYEDLEKVMFVYCEEGGIRQEFILSIREFSKYFKGATKALKLRKLT